MKWPESLAALIDYGIVDEVVRPLMSGKEAEVFLVRCGQEERVAKVYKEAQDRSFRQRADYTEGRRTRNSRDQRAVQKRTRHGREQDEAAWRVAEVERIHRLRNAGVRVPQPHEFVDGVLVMELVQDAEGMPAPRLGDVELSRAEAIEIYDRLILEVVRMLAADLVHGDLSEFNVLLAADGPVIIDFPQSVDPTHNRNARTLLLRDVENLHRFLRRHAPGRKIRRLGEEMWQLYEAGKLEPDTALQGTYRAARGKTDTGAVMALIEDAKRDAQRARPDDGSDDEPFDEGDGGAPESTQANAAPAAPGGRRVVDFTTERSGGRGGSRARRGKTARDEPERKRGSRGGRSGSPSDGSPKRGRGRNTSNDGAGPEERTKSTRGANAKQEPRAKEGTGRGRGRRRRSSRGGEERPARQRDATSEPERKTGKATSRGARSGNDTSGSSEGRGTRRRRSRRRGTSSDSSEPTKGTQGGSDGKGTPRTTGDGGNRSRRRRRPRRSTTE